jgi:hypothetical protein
MTIPMIMTFFVFALYKLTVVNYEDNHYLQLKNKNSQSTI